MTEHAYQRDDVEQPASAMPTVADALRLLQRRARIIIALALIGAALAFSVGLIIKPVYEAVAVVELDPRRLRISNITDVVSQLDADSPTIDSQIEIIQSSRIAGRVVDQLGLASDPEFRPGPGWRSTISGKIERLLGRSRSDAAPVSGTAPEASDADASYAVQALRSHISAARIRGSYLIEISVSSGSSEKATAIANAVAEAYIAEQVEAKAQLAQQATIWLDRQAVTLKQRVIDAERLVEAYKIENGLQTTEGHPLDERELTRAAEQLILQRAETAGAEARYRQVEGLAATAEGQETVASVLTSDTITVLKEELARQTRRYAELSTRYGALHPDMIRAQAELRDARQQLSMEVQKHVANLRNEYEVAKGRQASLEASLEQQKSLANASSEASVKLRELERDAEAARGVYESLIKRAAETKQQESLQIPDARLVNPAVEPAFPVSPRKLRFALAGFAAGFALAFGLSALIELLWPTFVRPREIEARMRLRHLASIPKLRTSSRLGEPGAMSDIRNIAVSPHTPFAEAVRAVRIAIDGERREAAELIIVTSALPGDGKSVIASNLAHLYALSGVKTLLVDADLRKGMLTRQLQPGASPGLLDCLQSGISPFEAIFSDRATGVNFMPSADAAAHGTSVPELLSSRQLAEIFSQLRREFEVIILDAPPTMPVVDARILAEHADQVVLVSRWRRTPPALVRRAGELLALSGATMTGLVVNAVDDAALPSETAYTLSGYGARDMRRAA